MAGGTAWAACGGRGTLPRCAGRLGLLVLLGLWATAASALSCKTRRSPGLWEAGAYVSLGALRGQLLSRVPEHLLSSKVRSNFLSFQGNLGFSYKPVFLTISFLSLTSCDTTTCAFLRLRKTKSARSPCAQLNHLSRTSMLSILRSPEAAPSPATAGHSQE